MFDLTRISRYIGGCHLTQVPDLMSYYIVVSIYSVRIMLLIVELNDLCINMRDIGSYYMNVDTRERL